MDAGTPALTRGLAVLRALSARRDGATAAELAAVVGAPRATLYRLLRTLAADRFVAPAPGAGGRYVLGPACAELAARAAGSRDLATVARPAMEGLAAALESSDSEEEEDRRLAQLFGRPRRRVPSMNV